MTVGFYAPLPPMRSGVADYAAALLGALRRLGPVKVDSARADVRLYHLGNNLLHRGIYRESLNRPGVAVLHDALLHHFFLGCLDREAYAEEFAYNYGEWSRGLALQLWAGRKRSAQDPRYFQYAMLRRAAETAQAVIVHNPGAAQIVAAHAPGARVVEIPHLFCPPELPPLSEVIRFRQAAGLGPRTFLFGVFGHLRESKRLAALLRAFQALQRSGRDVALLVAGEFVSLDLERTLAPLLAQPGILRIGYTPEREFWRLASAVDACVNLRYPAAGETSGVAIRLMGIGKPVLLSAGEETARFPETACLRVDHGLAEADMLTEYMMWLAGDREAAAQIGRRGAAHIRERHSLESVARRYWEVLCACSS